MTDRSQLNLQQERKSCFRTEEVSIWKVVCERDRLRERILVASGAKKAPLVLKGGRILNVFTKELTYGDVAIADGYIAGIGSYEGEEEIELDGMVVCPSFIDGHIHLESSMISPAAFEAAVLPHGTTAVVTDPHEIANVAGTQGIDYMLKATEDLELDVYFMLPSCVPAASLEESGAVLEADELKPYYSHPRVLGLAEMMNSYGTVRADESILRKLLDAKKEQKLIDGHAPGLSGRELCAYAAAGVQSDHECSDFAEALEKLRCGQWIMVREGTAARNLEALIQICREPYAQRCMFVTDDKHSGDLKQTGHIDGIIRKAIRLGADPVTAILMGSFHPARYFGLSENGAVAPGYRADLVILSDLEQVTVKQVYKAGELVAKDGKVQMRNYNTNCAYDRVFHSFHMAPVREEDFRIDGEGSFQRVICLTVGELLTRLWSVERQEVQGFPTGVNPKMDIVKLAVLERHHHTGHRGIGFLQGYGLKRGAAATSVAHDSHNLIVAGVNDADMAVAAEAVRRAGGGIAVAADGQVLGILPLPIGGLMTDEDAEVVDEKLERLKAIARELGVAQGIDPFMTLAFVSLPVIPKVRLNTCGLVDTEKQERLEVFFNIERK